MLEQWSYNQPIRMRTILPKFQYLRFYIIGFIPIVDLSSLIKFVKMTVLVHKRIG